MAPKKINIKDRLNDGEIDLSMSDLQDVPVKDISVYKKVYSLDLSNNHLKTLPLNFATLTHLTKLDLSNNELCELPENFGDLSKLKHLDLYQNQLQYLPLSFSKLQSLKWLDLKDNPLVPAVEKVAGQCLDAKQCQNCARDVVNFFTQVQQQIDEERKKIEEQVPITQPIKMDKKAKKSTQQPQQKAKPKQVTTKANTKKNKKGQEKKISAKSSCSYCKLILVFLLLAIISLFILTSIHCELTRSIEGLIATWYLKGTQQLPPNFQPYSMQFESYFKTAHNKTGNVTLCFVNYVKNTDNFVNAYNSVGDFIADLLKTVKEQYKKYVS